MVGKTMSIKSKTLLQKIKRNKPYFEDFITRSVFNSNRIEGNTLSLPETYSIIFDNKNEMEVKTTERERYEAINLKYAYSYILKNLENNITVDMIKKIAKYINKNIKDIDGFRKTQVFIKGASDIPPRSEQVPMLIGELIYKKGKEKKEDIFDYVARFHIEFEHIHLFEDGNGRTGRVLMAKELLSRGLAPVVIPYSKRDKYINCLDSRDIKGLSKMLKDLNEEELARMLEFGIKL